MDKLLEINNILQTAKKKPRVERDQQLVNIERSKILNLQEIIWWVTDLKNLENHQIQVWTKEHKDLIKEEQTEIWSKF